MMPKSGCQDITCVMLPYFPVSKAYSGKASIKAKWPAAGEAALWCKLAMGVTDTYLKCTADPTHSDPAV